MRYTVAVKRKFRDEIPSDWIERLLACKGLTLESGSEGLSLLNRRFIIEADAEGLEEAKAQMGEMLHIEPIMTHATSEDDGKEQRSESCDPAPDEPIETPWRRGPGP